MSFIDYTKAFDSIEHFSIKSMDVVEFICALQKAFNVLECSVLEQRNKTHQPQICR